MLQILIYLGQCFDSMYMEYLKIIIFQNYFLRQVWIFFILIQHEKNIEILMFPQAWKFLLVIIIIILNTFVSETK